MVKRSGTVNPVAKALLQTNRRRSQVVPDKTSTTERRTKTMQIKVEAMKNQKTPKADGKRDRMRHVNKAKTLKRKAQRQNKSLARAA